MAKNPQPTPSRQTCDDDTEPDPLREEGWDGWGHRHTDATARPAPIVLVGVGVLIDE